MTYDVTTNKNYDILQSRLRAILMQSTRGGGVLFSFAKKMLSDKWCILKQTPTSRYLLFIR